MKFHVTLFMLWLVFSTGVSQITIGPNDMPEVGDTLRYNVTYNTAGIDYTSAGPGHNWDFSALTSFLPQEADTFVHVWTTPLLYQLVFFYPLVSTIASPQAEFTLIPGFELTDIYSFFKESSNDFREVGSGMTINGIPLPALYDDPDIVYKFPVQYGNTDSSVSSFGLQVPDLGYYGRVKKRKNTVDGWGNITTPFGTFQALRIISNIKQTDSIYIDALGFGFPITTETTEYKWMVNGFGRPLVKVVESGILPTKIEYLNFPEETLTVDLGPDIDICQGQSAGIKAGVSGGKPPYYYFWSDFGFGDSITVSPNQTTNYWVLVMDSKFQFASDTISVIVHEPPVVDAGMDVTIMLTTVTQLNAGATGNSPPFDYQWTPEDYLSDPLIPDPLAGPVTSTLYTVYATDNLGCTGSDDVMVNVIQVTTWEISGKIIDDVQNQGLPNTEIQFTGMFPAFTDMNGNYSKTVHEGWSGTAKPFAENYYFEPDSILYSNVTSALDGQNFIAHYIAPPVYLISGKITDESTGNPAQNVTLEISGLADVITNDTGYYFITVMEGWTGTVSPTGYQFDPAQRNYSFVTQDHDQQNYIRKQGNLPPGWQFVQTSKFHILNIPASANPRIYGTPISPGDYLGVFFIDTEGHEKCGGALEWNGNGQNLTAYGNDDGTPAKEGFSENENFIWKIYTWNNFSEYYAEAEYHWLFSNDGKFHNLSFSRVTDLEVTGYAFNIKAILGGVFNGAAMEPYLNQKGYLPLSHPYNIWPWNYNGAENVAAIPNPDIIDWVLLELRESSGDVYTATHQTIVERKACFIKNDGSLVALNGASRVISDHTYTSNVYAVIYHRNHLGIMAGSPLEVRDGSFFCDLTKSSGIHGGFLGTIQFTGDTYAMVPGNGDSNTQVANPDKNDIWKPQSGLSGYNNGDFNLDGEVDNSDKIDIWEPNCGKGSQVIY
ncbi:MAG: hypothetical protein JXA03_05865 [Bacteroidales bacterium]|nr:hypothetical protein [Bacteroidales bacterium]